MKIWSLLDKNDYLLDFIHLELHLVGYIGAQYPTNVIQAGLIS